MNGFTSIYTNAGENYTFNYKDVGRFEEVIAQEAV